MEIGFSNKLRTKIGKTVPNINHKIWDISISINSEDERKYIGSNYNYTLLQNNKFHSLNYFLYLGEIYNDIRYALISALCCIELAKNEKATKDDLDELGYRLKFYVDSGIYKYYSFWEIVGRFFNEYFDLQLEINQKNYEEEKGFYFGREVLDKIVRNYDHKIIIEILSYWEKSKRIFEYRKLITHKRNTRIGQEILKITKEVRPKSRSLIVDVGKDYTINELLELIGSSHKYTRVTLPLIRNFFDLRPNEFEGLKKSDGIKTKLILPNKKSIYQFQKIIKCSSLLIKLR